MIQQEWFQGKTEYSDYFQASLDTYIEEVKEIWIELREEIIGSEQWSSPIMDSLLRKLHTVKGTSGQIGFRSLQQQIHILEDYFVQIKSDQRFPDEGLKYELADFCDKNLTLLDLLSPEKWIPQLDSEFHLLCQMVQNIIQKKPQTNEQLVNPIEKTMENSQLKVEVGDQEFSRLFSIIEQNLNFLANNNSLEAIDLTKANEQALAILIQSRRSSIKPLGTRLKRLVHSLSSELDKEIDFQIHGFDSLVDSHLIKGLSEILTHMIRNSLDHGIESREQRQQLGKHHKANVRIDLKKTKDRTIVEIIDDGKGLDPEIIVKKAVQNHLLSSIEAEKLTRYEKQGLIFKPGFSTKTDVSDVSGRGVGMDAVANEIRRLNGQLTFTSIVNEGTTFHMEFPDPYQVVPVVLFSIGNQQFFLQAESVLSFYNHGEGFKTSMGMVEVEDLAEEFVIIELHGLPVSTGTSCVVIQLGELRAALLVDDIIDIKESLVNSTPKSASFPKFLNGLVNDSEFGSFFGINLSEIETNFNNYLESSEDSDTPIAFVSNHPQEEKSMSERKHLAGKLSSKEEILQILDGSQLIDNFRSILHSEDVIKANLGNNLAEFIGAEIDHFKEVIHPITDDEDLHYMLAIRYAALKAQWIQLNTQMAYVVDMGKEADISTQYRASILSTLLAALEPLVHPEAVKYISATLSEPLGTAA